MSDGLPEVSVQQRWKIGVISPGGASPATNTAIHFVTKYINTQGSKAFGTRYADLFRKYSGPGHSFRELSSEPLFEFVDSPGTILETSRLNGRELDREKKDHAAENVRREELDGLIVFGGSGSVRMIHDLTRHWDSLPDYRHIPVIVIPKTIDNDIPGFDPTLGLNSVVEAYTEELIRIFHDSLSYADPQLLFYEVMGRDHGWIAVRTAHAFLNRVDQIKGQLQPSHPLYKHSYVAEEFRRRMDSFRFHSVLIPESAIDRQQFFDRLKSLMQPGVNPLTCVLLAEGFRQQFEKKEPASKGPHAPEVRQQLNEGVAARLMSHFQGLGGTSEMRVRCIIPSIGGRAVQISQSDRDLAALLGASACEKMFRLLADEANESRSNEEEPDRYWVVGTWNREFRHMTLDECVNDPGGKHASESYSLLREEFHSLRNDRDIVWWDEQSDH